MITDRWGAFLNGIYNQNWDQLSLKDHSASQAPWILTHSELIHLVPLIHHDLSVLGIIGPIIPKGHFIQDDTYSKSGFKAGLSIRDLTHSTCYCNYMEIISILHGSLLLSVNWPVVDSQFAHKVTSLLRVWRSRLQVNRNFLTAL